MGLFTTRQLLGYTEQKVKFRALFLELFFRRTVNFHTEEVMLDKITGKTPVAAYVSPVVEGKVLVAATGWMVGVSVALAGAIGFIGL
ncbi:major capsid protein, partial [Escherichia coli]|uniref:major capsid protein n=1 Tax=Escherichia coli TaxID=562 RepID=UPI0002AE312E